MLLQYQLKYIIKGFNKFYNGNCDAVISITLTKLLGEVSVILVNTDCGIGRRKSLNCMMYI